MDGPEDKVLSASSQAQQRKCSFHFYGGLEQSDPDRRKAEHARGWAGELEWVGSVSRGQSFSSARSEFRRRAELVKPSDVSVHTPPSHTLKKGSEANFLLFFLPRLKKSAMGFKKDPLFY